MSARELVARLTDAIPPPERVVPRTFLHDPALPPALAPVEPHGFALACVQALWGVQGPRN